MKKTVPALVLSFLISGCASLKQGSSIDFCEPYDSKQISHEFVDAFLGEYHEWGDDGSEPNFIAVDIDSYMAQKEEIANSLRGLFEDQSFCTALAEFKTDKDFEKFSTWLTSSLGFWEEYYDSHLYEHDAGLIVSGAGLESANLNEFSDESWDILVSYLDNMIFARIAKFLGEDERHTYYLKQASAQQHYLSRELFEINKNPILAL